MTALAALEDFSPLAGLTAVGFALAGTDFEADFGADFVAGLVVGFATGLLTLTDLEDFPDFTAAAFGFGADFLAGALTTVLVTGFAIGFLAAGFLAGDEDVFFMESTQLYTPSAMRTPTDVQGPH